MPRLKAIDPTQATGKAKDLLDAVRKKRGLVPNMMRTMANAPVVLEGYLGLSGALGAGQLGPGLREQIALAVAEANGCEYCLAAHTAIGKMVKLPAGEMTSARGATSADPKAAAALAFAVALVEGRGAVSDEAFARVRRAGFGDGEIAEIVAHVSLNVLTNYFNRATEVVVDFPRVASPTRRSA